MIVMFICGLRNSLSIIIVYEIRIVRVSGHQCVVSAHHRAKGLARHFGLYIMYICIGSV
jgi:hypothetical protein